MSRSPENVTSRAGGWIAGGTLLLWTVVLLFPTTAPAHPAAGRVVIALAVLWHLLNVYVWLVPAWRRSVIERRGPLLGVGFAFGASVVGSVADLIVAGVPAAAGVWPWRLLVFVVPFLLPLILRLPYRPHLVDLAVIALVIALPHLPGFDRPWMIGAPATEAGGLLATGLSAGSLGGAALLFTYFYGTRYWTLAPLDLKPRKGDGPTLVAAWGLGVAGAIIGALVSQGTPLVPVSSPPAGAWHWLWWTLTGAGLTILVETLLFRSLLQTWIAKSLSGLLRNGAMLSGPAAALITAVLHTGYGPFGLSREVGFVVSLALGLVFAKSNRYFPAAVAHGLTMLTLALLASGR